MSSASVSISADSMAGEAIAKSAGEVLPRGAEVAVTVVEPKRGWRALDLEELLRYHELLYFLAWRDIKVQYKQTVLGPLWAVLRPVLSLVIFSIVFGKLARIPSDGVPYPIFVYAGLLPWTFFSNAIVASTNSLLNHASILSKVYFPRILLPTASIGSGLATLLINFGIYACLMVWYGQLPGPAMVLLPFLVVLMATVALGLGYFLSGLTVIYRDIRFVVGSIVGAWMYLSPVIYPVTFIPEDYRWLLILNPMTGIIGGFRSSLLNQPVEWAALGSSCGFAVLMLVIGFYLFHRVERRVVDVA